MSESKIFCSVIIFTLGIYTIVLLQYELYKLNSLTSAGGGGGAGSGEVGGRSSRVAHNGNHAPSKVPSGELAKGESEKGLEGPKCNVTVARRKFNLASLNCGSASELISVAVQDCSELPCDIKPNVNYSVLLNFKPSRNISSLDIETFVRQRKDLKYLHKDTISTEAFENVVTTLKFSFEFPPHPIFQPGKKVIRKTRKCPLAAQLLYFLGVEIWDRPTGVGEICVVVPMLIQF